MKKPVGGGGNTWIVACAVFPRSSATWTISVVEETVPAVYTPVLLLIEPPLWFWTREKVIPVPLPPASVNV